MITKCQALLKRVKKLKTHLFLSKSKDDGRNNDTHLERGVQEGFSQSKCEGHPELLCGGEFFTNPLHDVCFGDPPEMPFVEKCSTRCLWIH
jgi:hypothetical protein